MKKYLLISLMFISLHTHSGMTNYKDCNTNSKPYHCHNKTVKNENYYNDIFCDSVQGKREVEYAYFYDNKKSYIKVDCETKNYVYEGGKDKRSSLDSIQQVLFFKSLTNKKPAIVIYNTDNQYGKYEHRIKTVAESLGIKFILKGK